MVLFNRLRYPPHLSPQRVPLFRVCVLSTTLAIHLLSTLAHSIQKKGAIRLGYVVGDDNKMDDKSFGRGDPSATTCSPILLGGTTDEWINRVIISYGKCNGCATDNSKSDEKFVRGVTLMSNLGYSWSCGFDGATSKKDLSPSVGIGTGIDAWLSGFHGRAGSVIDSLGLQWEWG